MDPRDQLVDQLPAAVEVQCVGFEERPQPLVGIADICPTNRGDRLVEEWSQSVLQTLGEGDGVRSRGRVQGRCRRDDLVDCRGKHGTNGGQWRQWLARVVPDDRADRCVAERMAPRQCLECQDPQAVGVGKRGDFLSAGLLR